MNKPGRNGQSRGTRSTRLTGLATAILVAAAGVGTAIPAAAAGTASPAAVAAEPKGKIDCSKYAGTEKEACEKMMSRRRS